MSNRRSRLRSELGNVDKINSALDSLALLLAESPRHISIEMGSFRANGADLNSFTLSSSGSTGNIAFKRKLQAAYASLVEGDLTFTARAIGTGGNAVSVEFVTGGTAGSEIVTVTGNKVSVSMSGGVSTATQIRTALLASAPAMALLSVAITGTAATAQAAFAETNLAGGINDGTLGSTETYDKADIIMIRRLRNRKWLIEINATANPA